MPRFERKTARRGRSTVPTTLPRTRRCRRALDSLTVRLGTLANLPPDVLALVADALALVGLGRTNLANLRSGLTDLLLVGALDDHLCRGGNLERDADARLDGDDARVAHLQPQARALY